MNPPTSRAATPLDQHGITPGDLALAALIGARFFEFAESGDQGDTLWLVVLTFLFGAVQAWWRWRGGVAIRRPDRIDAAVTALILPHVLSALVVILTQGQKRAALNMIFEWLSSLLIWFEVRRIFSSGRGAALLRTIVVLSVTLAGYGIWQNQVWFKQNAALVNEHEELRGRESQLSIAERRRMQEIARSLGPDFQSATGSTRKMLLDRFRESTEPMGCFGLANTFAGVLIVGLWTSWAIGLRFPSSQSKWGRFLTVLVLFTIGLCLIMTKSRTAFVGVLFSAGLYWFVRRTGKWYRRGVIAALTMLAGGVALMAVALITGLIDRLVISEAPKSLKYRLEYWSATSQVILDHPWLGVGPGNFRGHYLHHKLKGASEEILDPHNLFLDVWANGGIIAWSGLVAIVIWGIRTGWRAVVFETQSSLQSALPQRRSDAVKLAVAGPGLVAMQQLILGGNIEPRIVGFTLLCPVVAGLLSQLQVTIQSGAIWAAWIALTLHLCGAGGIAMPVIFQLWGLLLVALSTSPQSVTSGNMDANHAKGAIEVPGLLIAHAVVSALLAAGCLKFGLMPNLLCRAEMQFATETMASTGQRAIAEQQLIEATRKDPWNPEPWGLLLSLRGSEDPPNLSAAIEAGREAIARNPESPLYYEAIGDVLSHNKTIDSEHRNQAIEMYQEAARRYPNSVRIRTSLTFALSDAGLAAEAAEQAQLALELDDLNRAAVHWDKELPKEKRSQLEQLAKNRP